jgi:tRNA A-37 threonylcarbamoyl transferase component Bud32
MEIRHDRRRWLREVLNPPEIGILYTGKQGLVPGIQVAQQPTALYVDLLNRSMGGVILKTKWEIDPEILFHLQIYNSLEESWEFVRVKAKWINSDTTNPAFNLIGVEFQIPDLSVQHPIPDQDGMKKMPLPSDYEFLRHTQLFESVHRVLVCPLLNSLTYSQISAGEKFIIQGTRSDAFYIIQRGSCTARVDQNEKPQPVGRLQEGDHIGEMAMLTDQPQSVHIKAETDMELWGLARTQFDNIAAEHPELRNYLTELLVERFSSWRPTTKKRIGKYYITDIIGHGTNSIVYKGIHADLNIPVAVKMIRHELAMDSDFIESYPKRAKGIVALNHRNIVKVYDIVAQYRTYFVITELMEGETLASLIERWKTIPIPQATSFLIYICAGLAYAHEQDIFHETLKPSNLYVSQSGSLKILDFGLGCPTVTRAVNFPGTAAYMSPEQIRSDTVDGRSDIYALGMIAYEMLTGKRSSVEDTTRTAMDMPAKHNVPDLAGQVPGLPEILRRFIIKACAENPDNRYQNATAALKDLLVLAKSYGLESEIQTSEKRKMMNLILLYNENQQLALKRLLEEFSTKTKKLGVDFKAADFKDI